MISPSVVINPFAFDLFPRAAEGELDPLISFAVIKG
jgi:hypothetical protein